MLKSIISCLALFLVSLIGIAQIKLNPSYTYLKDGKEVGYNKGLKLLQSGDYVADVSDTNRTVKITKPKSLEVGDPFPFESMTDLKGKVITPNDLKGNSVVLNYWCIGCRPCVMEIPELNEIVHSFADQEVVFLAFANEIEPKVAAFIEKKPFDYTIVPNQMTATLNKGITIFPTHIFVNEEGIIEQRFSGYSEGVGDKISSRIQKMLN
jgi:peroxiredoxin